MVLAGGSVKNIIFRNEKNGFTVMNLLSPDGNVFRAVGTAGPVHDGDQLTLEGDWEEHTRHGRHFSFSSYSVSLPTTLNGIQAFLESGAIKGIGPKMARQIVLAFGTRTLQILENEPERLCELPNFGEKRLAAVLAGLQSSLRHRDTIIFLQGLSLSNHIITQAIQRFNDHAGLMVRDNPYVLTELNGIGFKRADVLAKNMGIEPHDEKRIIAGILYVLGEFIDLGHCYVPRELLLESGQRLLEVAFPLIETTLEELVKRKKLVIAGESHDHVYRADVATVEQHVAQHLVRLLKAPISGKKDWLIVTEPNPETADELPLSEGQLKALKILSGANVGIITGGPGTGKTTLVKTLVDRVVKHGLRIKLAAPTGRAAQRLREATGMPAMTIHRLLDFNPGRSGFLRHEQNTIEADVIIIDESSMIDIFLMNSLCRAIADKTRLVLVGDASQLPSIGPGNVLSDLISSNVVPVANLTEVFRQAASSAIIANAHRINRGEMIVIPEATTSGSQADFYFIRRTEPETVTQTLIQVITNRIPSAFNLDPLRDIQVITPMHGGVTGVQNLNRLLQAVLNPSPVAIEQDMPDFRRGDRVMQTRNNYNRGQHGVFNGDIGLVNVVDTTERTLTVQFDEPIIYSFDDLNELTLAYAITVHKSQGSEYPAVVLPLVNQNFILLQRNLLYTAITRAKKLVVIIGTTKALAIAINNDKPMMRYTNLRRRLTAINTESLFHHEKPNQALVPSGEMSKSW